MRTANTFVVTLYINRLSDLKPRTLEDDNIVTDPQRNREFLWLKAALFKQSTNSDHNQCLKDKPFHECFIKDSQQYPNNLLLQALVARSQLKQKAPEGVKQLQRLLKLSPDNWMLKTELMIAHDQLKQHQQAKAILETLPDHRNPSFHQLAIAIAKNADDHFLQAKHEYLQFWHSGREKQAKAYQNHILRLNEFELAEKDQLRALFKQYPTNN